MARRGETIREKSFEQTLIFVRQELQTFVVELCFSEHFSATPPGCKTILHDSGGIANAQPPANIYHRSAVNMHNDVPDHQSAFDLGAVRRSCQPGGLPDISRGLSAAIPPVTTPERHAPRRGARKACTSGLASFSFTTILKSGQKLQTLTRQRTHRGRNLTHAPKNQCTCLEPSRKGSSPRPSPRLARRGRKSRRVCRIAPTHREAVPEISRRLSVATPPVTAPERHCTPQGCRN